MRPVHFSFFASLFLSRLADQILLFLVPLVVYRMTGSAAWSGAAFFFETLPRFLSFPACGILCDRVSPLRLLSVSQILRALACLGGIAGHWAVEGVGWLIALSAVAGVLNTQGRMAREVMLPQVFRERRYEEIVAHAEIADQLGTILGPVAGAALLDLWPWETVVAAAAAIFLCADVAVALWRRFAAPVLAPPETHRSRWIGPLTTAATHVLRLPGLALAILLTAAVNLVIGVTTATSAAMVVGTLARSDGDYALLQAAGAVATVAILYFVTRTSLAVGALGMISTVALVAGCAMTGLGAGAAVYAAGYLVVMGFDKMFSVYIRSVRQRIIPPRDFGKTTGLVIMLNNLSQPLAGLLVALLAGPIGVENTILAMALAAGLVAAAAFAAMRARGVP
ncbi:MAG: MFS transporter [Alphaproteobacteria bacterium]|nr:MFS transporter [Alphaproteobacteria bacterium]